MTQRGKHWCIKPIINKHRGNYKKVIFNPENIRDPKPYVCRICGMRYSKEELN